MSKKITIKLPEWQHKAIKKIQDGYERKSIPKTIENILVIFTGLNLAMSYDLKFTLNPEAVEDEELSEALKKYWASMGQDKVEERILDFWEEGGESE